MPSFAVSIAFPLAYFLWRFKVAYARALFGLGIAPFMLPPVITALGFLLFWVNIGWYGRMPATIVSHAIFFVTLPLVTISLVFFWVATTAWIMVAVGYLHRKVAALFGSRELRVGSRLSSPTRP